MTGAISQYSQEGYDVYELLCPELDGSNHAIQQIASDLNKAKIPFVVVTYGLRPEDVPVLCTSAQNLIDLGLRGMIHYSPLLEDGRTLLIVDSQGRYIP